jgi:hypothetical protein
MCRRRGAASGTLALGIRGVRVLGFGVPPRLAPLTWGSYCSVSGPSHATFVVHLGLPSINLCPSVEYTVGNIGKPLCFSMSHQISSGVTIISRVIS